MKPSRLAFGLAAFSLLIGCVLAALPLVSFDIPGWSVLAWPGMALSGLLGSNNEWGLPSSLGLYFIGGAAAWAGFVLLVSVLVLRLRAHRTSSS